MNLNANFFFLACVSLRNLFGSHQRLMETGSFPEKTNELVNTLDIAQQSEIALTPMNYSCSFFSDLLNKLSRAGAHNPAAAREPNGAKSQPIPELGAAWGSSGSGESSKSQAECVITLRVSSHSD